MGGRVERRRARLTEGDDAPAETAARQARAEHARRALEPVDQVVHFDHGDPEVVAQAAMPVGHDVADTGQVALGQEALDLAHPLALGDHVAGPPSLDGIGEHAEIGLDAAAEGTPDLVGRRIALRAPEGVRGESQLAAGPAVHDHEGRAAGDGHVVALQGRGGEVDAQRVARPRVHDGQRVEQADMGPGLGLGLLIGQSESDGVEGVPEGQQQGDREGGARRQAGADGDRAGDPHVAAGFGVGQLDEGGRQYGLGR